MNKKIRIGLLMDSFNVPAWVFVMLKRILKSDFLTIELIVLNEKEKDNIISVSEKIKRILYSTYMYLENKIVKSIPDAFEIKNVESLLNNIPVLKVTPIQKEFFDYFEDSDIKTIKTYEIDVLICLGFRILRGEILYASRLGIWSYHHGDSRIYRGGPPGFWEVMEGHPETGSILKILNEDSDNGKIIYESYSSTDHFSVKRNRNNCYWKSTSFIPRKLEELYKIGEKRFLERVDKEREPIRFYCKRLYKEPNNLEMLKLLIRQFLKYSGRKLLNRFYFNQWFLMFNFTKDISSTFCKFKKLLPPKDRIWADPHIIFKNEKYFIFIEELLYKTRKGHISLIVMDSNGSYEEPVKIIEKSYHLSYPFIFEWEGNYYMIPETDQNRTIELYKCIQFPLQWEFQMNLLENISAFDTTVFWYQKKWWLFTNIIENEGASPNEELFLFYSEDLISNQWISHPLNPIVSDVKRARPAGKIFKREGRIYRPSQDCSKRYGYGIKINEIKILDTTEYKEIEISSIGPKWDRKITAIHTFNYENDLTIIDCQIRRTKKIFK